MKNKKMFYFGLSSISLLATIALFGIDAGSFNIAAKTIGTITTASTFYGIYKFFNS